MKVVTFTCGRLAGNEQDGAVADIYKPEPSNENGGYALNNPKPGVLVSEC